MKSFQIDIRWACYFGLMTIVWSILEKELGWYNENIAQYGFGSMLFAIPAVLFYYLAMRQKRDALYPTGAFTWTQGFVAGIYLSFFVAIFMPGALFLSYKYICPDFFDNIIAYKVNHHWMKQAEAEKIFNLRSALIEGSFSALSKGSITGGLVAIFLKRKA